MGQIISAFTGIFKFHKLKILAVFGFALIFGFMIFPFDDLSDVISAKISDATKNNFYVQFEDFGIKLIPSLGVSMENVMIEAPALPAMKAGHLELSPWVLGLVTGKQGGSMDARDLFGGVVAADFREGEKAKSGERMQSIAVNAQDVKLQLLTAFLRDSGMFGLNLQGAVNVDSAITVDPVFDKQPSGTIEIQAAGLAVPAQTFTANMNGMPLPVELSELKLGATKLTGKIDNGSIEISDLTFGSAKESLSGKVKGTVGVQFKMGPLRSTVAIPGAYDLRVDLTLRKDLVQSSKGTALGMGLGFLPKPKSETSESYVYAFRVQGEPNAPVPTITAIQ